MSEEDALIKLSLARLIAAREALLKSEKRLSDVDGAIDAASLYMQDDFIDATVAKSGKSTDAVVEVLWNIRPRLKETYNSHLAMLCKSTKSGKLIETRRKY